MSEELANVPEGDVQGQPVSEFDGGEAMETAPEAEGGETGLDASENGQPDAGDRFDGMTADQLFQSYKNLQREFTSKSENLSGFEKTFSKFGGTEKAEELLEYLSGNESFGEWVKAQQQAALMGSDYDVSDPATKAAIDLVQKIADQRINEAMKKQVEPLADSYKQRILKENFKVMDEKYPNWREMQSKMAEIAETLPADIQDNPSINDIEMLYMKSLMETGKFDDFAKSKYENTLREAKAKSTSKPAGPIGGKTRAKSIEEAWAQAKATEESRK